MELPMKVPGKGKMLFKTMGWSSQSHIAVTGIESEVSAGWLTGLDRLALKGGHWKCYIKDIEQNGFL